MALREPTLISTAPVNAGQLYVANIGPGGTPKPVVSPITGTVAQLETALGATVIQQIDVVRRAGAFLGPSANGNREIFET